MQKKVTKESTEKKKKKKKQSKFTNKSISIIQTEIVLKSNEKYKFNYSKVKKGEEAFEWR